jgi:hypothetical protein
MPEASWWAAKLVDPESNTTPEFVIYPLFVPIEFLDEQTAMMMESCWNGGGASRPCRGHLYSVVQS